MNELNAKQLVCRGFGLVVQINKVDMGRRAITEITEIEPVVESGVIRMTPLYRLDRARGGFVQEGRPTQHLLRHWAMHGVNYDGVPGRP